LAKLPQEQHLLPEDMQEIFQDLTELIIKANAHKGFSVIDVLQPCVTLIKTLIINSFRKILINWKNYDATNKEEAFKNRLNGD